VHGEDVITWRGCKWKRHDCDQLPEKMREIGFGVMEDIAGNI
jgi:hypothetical protein